MADTHDWVAGSMAFGIVYVIVSFSVLQSYKLSNKYVCIAFECFHHQRWILEEEQQDARPRCHNGGRVFLTHSIPRHATKVIADTGWFTRSELANTDVCRQESSRWYLFNILNILKPWPIVNFDLKLGLKWDV